MIVSGMKSKWLWLIFVVNLAPMLDAKTPIPWHRADPDKPCLGQNTGCCTAVTPCEEGDGDCDSGHDCMTGLSCGFNNCVPPESGMHWFNAGDDCCEPKTKVCDGEDDCCTVEDPCDIGEGDCDWDHECRAYLICKKDSCTSSTFDADDDCCWEKDPET